MSISTDNITCQSAAPTPEAIERERQQQLRSLRLFRRMLMVAQDAAPDAGCAVQRVA